MLLRGGFVVSLLLLRGFRARPRAADERRSDTPDKQDPHHNHEVRLANHGETLDSPPPLANHTYPPPATSSP